MKVKTLTLDNFQSYEHETINFDEGVSLFHGDNGAGKSTVLRAVFAGLFQTDMRSEASSDFDSIGELVRKGEEEGGVELTFEVGGHDYTVTWRISVEDPEEDEPTGNTTECVLESTALANPVDGVKSVRKAIQEEIIGMDARSFVNSVYVQQDEVMRLITADEGERKQIFDDLLGLSRIDEYMDRTVQIRREAKAKRDEAANRRDELQHQLDEEYPDRDELVQKRGDLADKLSDAEAERDRLEDELDSLKSERDDVQDRIDGYEDLQDEQETLTQELSDLNTRIEEVQADIESLESEIADHNREKWQATSTLNGLDDDIDAYDLTDADAVDDAVSELESERVEANRAETEAEQELRTAKNNLSDAKSDRNDLESERDSCIDARDDATAAVRAAESDLTDARERLEAQKDARDDAVESFLTDVDEAVPDDITQSTRSHVAEVVERLDGEREDTRNEITRLEAERSNATDRVARLEADIEAVEDERADALDALPADVREAEEESDGSVVETRVQAAQDAAEPLDLGTPITVETLEELRDTVIPDAQAALDAEYRETLSEFADLSGQETHLDARLSEFNTIQRKGECPVCGEDVSDENDHHEDERKRVTNELSEVQVELVDVRNARDDLEAKRDALAEVRDRVSEALLVRSVAEYDDELASLRDELTDAEATVASLASDIEDARSRQETLEARVERGRDDVLAAFERVELATDAVSDAEDALSDAKDDLQEAESDLDDVTTEIEALEERIETLETAVEEADDGLAQAQSEREAVEATLETVREAADVHDALDRHETAIENKEAAKENKNEMLDTLRSQHGEKTARLNDVEEELQAADLDDLEDERDQLDADIDATKSDLSAAKDEVDTLNGDLARVENRLESYDTLAGRVEDLDADVEWATGVVGEMNDLIETYDGVKLQLRQENLKLINAYANEVFNDLYHSASYKRILLNEDYTIQLIKSDGSRISPKLSSGGESAIVNIAIRAGVYRTIAERNQTASSGLPPFILDEPTTFLDSGHVQELEQVIESVKDWDVEQVLLVSHDDALIDSADYEYEVTKETATDLSSCTQRNSAGVP